MNRKSAAGLPLTSTHSTRGACGTSSTLNDMGGYEEALKHCEQLRQECGDEDGTSGHEATIFLNTRRWAAAAEAAERSGELFTEAFARFELGQVDEARTLFLRGALNYPRAAHLLVRLKTGKASSMT